MTTLTAKFNGQCCECHEPIRKGETIVFYAHKRSAHQSCAKAAEEDQEQYGEDERAGFEPGTLASDRRLARQGISVIRTSSGSSWTVNSRGRCEDAPCCGCCT